MSEKVWVNDCIVELERVDPETSGCEDHKVTFPSGEVAFVRERALQYVDGGRYHIIKSVDTAHDELIFPAKTAVEILEVFLNYSERQKVDTWLFPLNLDSYSRVSCTMAIERDIVLFRDSGEGPLIGWIHISEGRWKLPKLLENVYPEGEEHSSRMGLMREFCEFLNGYDNRYL